MDRHPGQICTVGNGRIQCIFRSIPVKWPEITGNCEENGSSIPHGNSPEFSGHFPARSSRKRDGKRPAKIRRFPNRKRPSRSSRKRDGKLPAKIRRFPNRKRLTRKSWIRPFPVGKLTRAQHLLAPWFHWLSGDKSTVLLDNKKCFEALIPFNYL